MKRQNIYRDYFDTLFNGARRMRKSKRFFRRLAKRRMRQNDKKVLEDEQDEKANQK